MRRRVISVDDPKVQTEARPRDEIFPLYIERQCTLECGHKVGISTVSTEDMTAECAVCAIDQVEH